MTIEVFVTDSTSQKETSPKLELSNIKKVEEVNLHICGAEPYSGIELTNGRTIEEIAKKYVSNSEVNSFQILNHYEGTVMIDGKPMVFRSPYIPVTGYVYINGTAYTHDEIVEKFPEKTGLINNNINHQNVILSKDGSWDYFNKGDSVISVPKPQKNTK